jgi:GNAT superfamily N-acetyltransferase
MCVIAAAPGRDGLVTLGRAVDAAGRSPVVVHAGAADLAGLLAEPAASRFAAAAVRCEAGIDRALAAASVLDLLGRGFAVALLEQRLDWVRERRALFGALPAEELDGLPAAIVSWLRDAAAGGPRRVARSAPANRQRTTNGGNG